MLLLECVLLMLLFGFSSFFSASETAITALSAFRMKQLSVLRPELRSFFSDWLEKPHRLLATILIGNNFVNVAISSLMAVMVVPLAVYVPKQFLDFMVWLAATAILMVLCEITPKIIGRVFCERISEKSLPVLSQLTRLFFLFWGPLGWILKKTAPKLAAPPANRLTTFNLEELRHIIGESQAMGEVPGDSGEMMKRVLELPQRAVSDIMQSFKDVDFLNIERLDKADSPVDLFVDLMAETGHTRIPVFREGAPIGHVNVLNLLKKGYSGALSVPEDLIRPVRYVSADKKVLELLGEFQRSGDHLALVKGTDGQLQGLVTLEDVLEEIVGEILDEYDLEKK